MNLKDKAPVFTADGKEIGNLSRFVLDPKTKKVTHIVVNRGTFSSHEIVLPFRLVDHADDDRIHLKALDFNIDELPSFVEEHFMLTNEHVMSDSTFISADPGLRMYYHYPPANLNPLNAPGFAPDRPSDTYTEPMFGPNAVNPIPVSGADEMAVSKEIDENIPANTVALKEGAKVMSSEYHHLGDIDKLVVDTKTNQVTHMVISKGFIFKERKLVPVDWIEKIYEDEVHLAMREEFLQRLPDYKQ